MSREAQDLRLIVRKHQERWQGEQPRQPVPLLPSRLAPMSLLDRRPEDKTRASADAAADVAAFLAAGGKIQQIPEGLSSETPAKVADAMRGASFRVVQDIKASRRQRA